MKKTAEAKPQTEYELIQAQILERKMELRRNGFPEQMYQLWSILRYYPGWAANGFKTPLHPLASNLSVTSTGLVNFTFNGNNYSIDFHKGRPTEYDMVFGSLTIRLELDEVMKSSFSAKEGQYGTEPFKYSDSSVFKKGPWAEDLARFQLENHALREADKKQQIEGPANLAVLRERFGLPSPPPPLPAQSIPFKAGGFWRRLFSR